LVHPHKNEVHYVPQILYFLLNTCGSDP